MTGSDGRPRVLVAVARLEPAGGLEQHVVRLAVALRDRGAIVTLFTTRAPSAGAPEGVRVILSPSRGRTNHGRFAAFAREAAREAASGGYDRTVAAHAIPGFDTLFLADPSRSHPRPPRSWLPRYRTFAGLEDRAFGKGGASLALFLAGPQRDGFAASHPRAKARFELLPPTIEALDRGAAPPHRSSARARLGLPATGPAWLWMGLQPHTKGLDRALAALAARPDARLVVSGLDRRSRSGAAMDRRSQRLGVAQRVVWLGFADRGTLDQAFSAADLLLHPSRADVTGTVILEAVARGLPVVTTAVCGYGEHVQSASAGVVLGEPFRPVELVRALASATPERLAAWSHNAAEYVAKGQFYGGLGAAADLILAEPARPSNARHGQG